MADFYVQWSKPRKRVRFHYAQCAACKGHKIGTSAIASGKTHDCEEFTNYDEAAAAAHVLAAILHTRPLVCGLCSAKTINL